jgi:Icc-related predicted phosphoesterase
MNRKVGPVFLLLFTVLGGACSWSHPSEQPRAAMNHVALDLATPSEFVFVAFGDTRFHDPSDTEPANPAVRQALVSAIDRQHPAFVSIGGDIVYNGENPKDWQVWDSETKVWLDHRIPVYPALGNHDLKGDEKIALENYFARFPYLNGSRFYSVRLGHCRMLVLDSALEELSGPQGEWLRSELDQLPVEVDFLFLVFHHPPYTSSSDEKAYGGGHSARAKEQALAKFLEERQQHARARFVVFNGHVHNYERHEHAGVTYFVTGGGGAHAYPIPREPGDPYKDPGINYHFLLVEVNHNRADVAMNKLEFKDGKAVWSKADSVTLTAPLAPPAAAD